MTNVCLDSLSHEEVASDDGARHLRDRATTRSRSLPREFLYTRAPRDVIPPRCPNLVGGAPCSGIGVPRG
jgi:hypothetical protein